MRQLTLALAAVALAASASSPALASSATFTIGNLPQPGEQAILFTDQGPATTLVGNGSVTATDTMSLSGFTTAGNQFTVASNIVSPASGLITSLTFSPSSPLTALIVDPFNGTGTGNYSVVMTDNAVFNFSMGLGTGNNFLTITADPGSSIASVTLSDSGGSFGSMRAIRAAFAAVPEPGSWALMLLGFGAIGAALRMRRRASAAA